MNLVLIHIGNTLPSYFWSCVDQIRRYSTIPLYVVFDSSLLDKDRALMYRVNFVPIYDFLNSKRVKEFSKLSFLEGYGDFWNFAFKRLFVLEEIMKQFELERVIHIENDILIYEDPQELAFSSLTNGFVHATPIGPKYTTYAYCYIDKHESLKNLNDENLKILARGKETLTSQYGEGMVNEMLIASELTHKGILKSLPTLPTGPASDNLGWFNSLFDGASWGQFVGGVPGNETPWKGDHHYVGAELIGNNYSVTWHEEKNFKVPYVRHKYGMEYKLNNLHLHSKNLERWK